MGIPMLADGSPNIIDSTTRHIAHARAMCVVVGAPEKRSFWPRRKKSVAVTVVHGISENGREIKGMPKMVEPGTYVGMDGWIFGAQTNF